MSSNIRLAFRRLRQAPVVASLKVASLGVSMGCCLAVFPIVNQVLLAPLPVHDPQGLVNLEAPGPKPGFQGCNVAGRCEEVFSYPMFRDLQREQTVFAELVAHRPFGIDVTHDGRTISGQGIQVSGAYFRALGLLPALGSLPGPRVDEPVGGHPVVVVSHDYWESELGGSRDILGEVLVVNGHSLTIIGVAPRGFRGTTHGVNPTLFVPLSMSGAWSGGGALEDRRSYWLYIFARLAPDVSIAQARAALEPLYRGILAEVEAPLQDNMSEQDLARFVSKPLLISDGSRGQSGLDDVARTPLVFLLSMTLVVVLVACVNSANLMLGLLVNRAPEIALRRSLGASGWQVAVQLMTESCVLGLISAAMGLGVAQCLLGAVAAVLPTGLSEIILWRVDYSTVQFGLAVSLWSGVFLAAVSAYCTMGGDRISLQGMGEFGAVSAQLVGRVQKGFGAVQLGLAMTLIVVAGILMRSVQVGAVGPNAAAERVVTFRIAPVRHGYDSEQTRALVQRIRRGLATMPGISGVTAAAVPAFARGSFRSSVVLAGQDTVTRSASSIGFNVVDDDYFGTLGIPIVTGRVFRESDDSQAPLVAIVNEAFVRTFGLGREAVGRRMGMGRGLVVAEADMEIVGVVADAEMNAEAMRPFFYVPYGQADGVGSFTFYAGAPLAPGGALRSIAAAVAGFEPRLQVSGVRTLSQEMQEAHVVSRLVATLALTFGGVAALLATVGVYSIVTLAFARRTREIGLRMALGAGRGRVWRMVLAQVGQVVGAGCCLGFLGSVAAGAGVESVLEGTAGVPLVGIVLVSGMGLGSVAAMAGVVPAWRASRLNPMVALRKEA